MATKHTDGEAPDDAPLGQYAFPHQRKGIPLEPDTRAEKRLYAALRLHFTYGTPIEYKDAVLMSQFIENGWYSTVFREPIQTIMYRGMNVSKSWVCKALQIKDGKLSNYGKKKTAYTFTPRDNMISSWSVSKDSAAVFSDGSEEYAIIMIASIDDNRGHVIGCDKTLYKVKGLDGNASEHEVIGIGNIHVNELEWMHADDNND